MNLMDITMNQGGSLQWFRSMKSGCEIEPSAEGTAPPISYALSKKALW